MKCGSLVFLGEAESKSIAKKKPTAITNGISEKKRI